MDSVAAVVGDSFRKVKAPRFSSSKGVRSEFLLPPAESCVNSVTDEPVLEENAPKESDPSKFFSAIAANGSKAVLLKC